MGSCNPGSGERYRKSNGLPEAPTFIKYKEHLDHLLQRLSDVSQIALCTLPPVGEFPNSTINQHIVQFNHFIQNIAQEKEIELLDVSHAMWETLNQRTYPVTQDYDSKLLILGKRVINACFRHYVFKTPWDTVAQSQGQWLLFDQIHLGERGAQVIQKLMSDFLKK